MKTILLLLTFVFLFSFFGLLNFSGSSSAVNIFSNCGSNSADGNPVACQDANTGQTNPTNPAVTAIRLAIQLMAVVVGLGAVIGIIVSGIRISIAHGDASAVASARSALIYSLVGLGIAALAQLIVIIIVGFLS